MTIYALDDLAAKITPLGIFAPSYNDILLSLTAAFQSIYGSDSYLGPDSQDGQFIAVMALSIHNVNNAAVAVYNAYSPSTAIGVGLSNAVKINGLARLVPSNSSVDLTIVGTAGTTITNGAVGDINGTQWNLPAEVIIPIGGSIVVTAISATEGAIIAPASSVNRILTPTRGWQTATNADPAVPGAPVESDATLRVRQSVSTELPSLSIIGGIDGAIANIPGVEQRKLYENDTGVPDSDGLPGHSISAVVLGGDAEVIAEVIARKKTPGTGTYGDITQIVYDSTGVPVTISFFRPDLVPIELEITIQPRAGYVSTTGALIIASILEGNNSQGIGGDIYIAKQFSYANLVGTGLENTFDVTLIEMSRDGDPVAPDNIEIAFDELATQVAGDITLTVLP